MNPASVITVDHVSKSFWVHARSDATILSRMADLLPSGAKRHHSRCIQAVKDVSFTVEKGEVLGIIGKNASGKTTLLRLIAGIHVPDSGKVYTEGKIISLINLSVGLKNRLSVLDNIFLTCSMYGMSRSQIQDVIKPILEFAGVQQYVDMYPYQLSQGMSQRLSFSIAVHTKPDILLLDEVFSAGDIQFKQKAAQKIEELIFSDISVVMVSHDLNKIAKMCDRVLWIDKGAIRQSGAPKFVLGAYRETCSVA